MVNQKIRAWEGRLGMLTKTSSARGGRRDTEALVTLSASSGNKCKRKKDILRVSFHERLMQMAGWKDNTLLDVELMAGKGTVFPSPDGKPAKILAKTSKRYVLLYYFEQGSLDGFPSGVATGVECDKGIVAFNLPR